MIQFTESLQAWLESITHQMTCLSYQEQSKQLGGPIGMQNPHHCAICID